MTRIRAIRLLLLLAVGAVAGLAASGAWSYWSGGQNEGSGTARAATVNQAAAPTASAIGDHVTLSWGVSTLSSGHPIEGYEVTRYDADTGDAVPALTDCAGVVTGTNCLERGAPVGRWQYTIRPVLHNWRGPESSKSGVVDTGPADIALDKTLFGATLPETVTGTLSGFAPGSTVLLFHDDDEAPLDATVDTVDENGDASFSVTIPSLADGTHTITARSDDGGDVIEASTGILVDTTPATLTPFLTPEPNAAGWNNTSPVTVDAAVDDGNGSGIAYVRYTDDGSDPHTSPTAQYALAAFNVTETTTFRYFSVDNAGNESPTQTLEVKIDTEAPLFGVALTNVSGGAYLDEATAQIYYRGIDAGSFQLLVTPFDTGGSGPMSAATSGLGQDAAGFTHDSAPVSTPEGGPYLLNPYSWVAGTTSAPAGTLTVTDVAGNSLTGSGTLTNDSAAPSGGSVDATGLIGTGGRYSTSRDLTIALAKGTDQGSGLAPSGSQLQRASAPLTSGGAANGTCGTYGTYTQIGSDDPEATVSNTVPDDGCYRYRYRVPDNVGNVATYTSPDIKVESVAPSSLSPTTATITPLSGTGFQSVSGSSVYYNPAQAGSFQVDSSASDTAAGIAQVAFPSITGFTGGGNVTTPASGTTFRSSYSWSNNGTSASPGTQSITAAGNAGYTATNSSAFSVIKDATAPAGGSVDATGLTGTGSRYSTSTTLSVGFDPGSDSGSGLATSGAQLQRASATLTSDGTSNGACGTFGGYSQVGASDPVSPKSDTVLTDRTCYRYRYLVNDKVANQAPYTSPDIKVDGTAPPAPGLSFSGTQNAYWPGSGSAVYYKPAATSGSFTLTASSLDTTAGISGYSFPTLPSGWASAGGGTGVITYSWSSANPTVPFGGQTVTATNNAGRQSSSTFTAVPDSAAPSGGSIAYTGGFQSSTSVAVSFAAGSDSGSGVDASTGILARSTGTLTPSGCQSFGSFTPIQTNPTSPYTDTGLSSGSCYQYRYVVSDRLGNQASYDGGIVKVDSQAPTHSLSLTSASGAYLTGGTLYYKGNATGSFKLVDALSDDASGPASVTYPSMSTTGWTHTAETVSTPSGGPYTSSLFSWTANPTAPIAKTISGADAAGNSASTSLSLTNDSTLPTGGSISYTNGMLYALSVPVTTVTGTDSGSGIASAVIKRAQATLTTSTGVCGTFDNYATTVTLVGGADTGVTSGNCYQYELVVTDNVGNVATYTSASVAKVDSRDYSAATLGTTGLLGYWRLGESASVTDSFTGSAGTTLQSHSPEIGGAWSLFNSSVNSVITDANRIRRNGTTASMYLNGATLPSADYSVQTEVTAKSLVTNDAAGVIGRASGSGENYYLARYLYQGALSGGTWRLEKVVNGTATVLGSTTAATLNLNQTYRLRLSMIGSTISLWVDGTQLTSVTDTTYTAKGQAGIRLGTTSATTTPTNLTGLHEDNFRTLPPAQDSIGTNDGTYWNGTTLGVPGALSNDADTAASFDGVDDYVSIARQISNDFSIEFWFKSTQGLNTNTQWWGNAGLVDAEVSGAFSDFGTSLRSDGKVVAGDGTPDVSIVSSSGGYDDGNWHHVVFTRVRTTGAMVLYVDGSQAGTATGSTASLTSPSLINFGRIQTGTNYFAGSLDEVAIYSSALSAATVADHYARRNL